MLVVVAALALPEERVKAHAADAPPTTTATTTRMRSRLERLKKDGLTT
jgi:hypothetical protein